MLSCAACAYDFEVSYRAHYDGPVSDITVRRKTDRKFVSAVVSAVSRWRFKPWDVSYQKTSRCSSNGEIPVRDGPVGAMSADDHAETGRVGC
jgi:beta-galactosidase/beta-glucuronidase